MRCLMGLITCLYFLIQFITVCSNALYLLTQLAKYQQLSTEQWLLFTWCLVVDLGVYCCFIMSAG